ncbi:ATP-dependent endonuclease [Grimontia hollisae]|uniref:Recombination protein F n=2 Tax=Grimontia hollisae TaxID=673 RepID=A0A377J8F0_GRIHO|nr:DUF2813 domain-containing protein [Grimontia hollisae]AMG29231.1 ATP-dependent endonuclease [Grimontia hollisae]EEY73157.1 hypothetical ATP-dependent endonuclease of the OLD family [Grimontia hollisae CIP 101886]MDF2184898.1 DUF2813 domain-containing protein [Grimontia hollisae]STO76631.1 recombination protein F [Grimontia hollisae]STO98730.1 recombination protein F [Grimontia hollisae]
MKLDRIEISGFRGIRRLSLSMDELTVLIGENAWGKSSLLDALSLCLPSSGEHYAFKRSDFHIDYTLGNAQTNQIQIIFRWVESFAGEHRARRYRQFNDVWNGSDDNGLRRLDFHINALYMDGKITVSRDFLDTNGNIIDTDKNEALAQKLVLLHPIIRIQDARRLRDNELGMNGNKTRLEKRLENTVKRLQQKPGHVNKGEIHSGLKAMRTLLDHYFAFNSHNRSPAEIEPSRHLNMRANYVHPLELVANNTSNHSRLLLMGLLSTFVRARGPKQLKANARPIVIFEDPESRLHPTLLNQAWRLISIMPMQKILTTNSGDLLSAVPLTSIRRLERGAAQTESHQVPVGRLSKDEERRVSFHVRFHRPSALFARCWLLVEGETEVWLFNEMARIQGYDLSAEGVQMIEFAQSGLKPLIKLAIALGIEWHVITDGDWAGQKYAHTVRSRLGGEKEKHRLTVLPERDIEHYLFAHGYEPLFRQMANIEENTHVSPKKIIARALKKYAKPDAALAIIEYTEQHLEDDIPLLLRWIVQRVVSMARGSG